jgi:hypothetical protein
VANASSAWQAHLTVAGDTPKNGSASTYKVLEPTAKLQVSLWRTLEMRDETSN